MVIEINIHELLIAYEEFKNKTKMKQWIDIFVPESL